MNPLYKGYGYLAITHGEKKAGLDKAKNSFPFRRYVLERHDMGMDEFLRQNLSAEDYSFHQEYGKSLADDL